MATLTDKIQVLDDVDPFLTRDATAADIIQTSSEWEFGADVKINANLTVAGVITAIATENTLVADPHLYLNAGYTTPVATTGGLVINYLPTTTATTPNGNVTAGVASSSNPTIVTSGSGTFTAGDFVQLSGFTDAENAGLFEVLSHVGTTLSLRGVGVTGTQEDFTQTQLVTRAGETAGAITKVNVSILRAGTDGAFETASGSSSPTGSPLVFVDIAALASVTLDQAYQNGNTINTTIGDGDVVVAGTERLSVTASGGVDIDTQFDFDGTVFDVQMSGTNGFSIDGTAASNVSVASGNLTLATTVSGDVAISAATAATVDAPTFSIDGTTSSNVTVTGNSAGAQTLTLSALNSGAGAGNVQITAKSEADITASTVDVNASGAVTIDAGTTAAVSAATTVTLASASAETLPGVVITQSGAGGDSINFHVGGIDPSAGAGVAAPVGSVFFRDVGNAGTLGEIYIKVGAANNLWAAAAALGQVTLQQAYIGGNTLTTSASEGPLTVSGTEAISFTAGGAGSYTVASGSLTLSTTTAGNVAITAADDVTIDGDSVSIGATETSDITLAASGAGQDLTVAVTGATNSSLVLRSEGTGGDALQMTATAGGIDITMADNLANALVIADGGGTSYLAFTSTNGAETIRASANIITAAGVGIGVELVTSAALVQGDLVRITAAGQWGLADANAATLDAFVVGVSLGSFALSATARCNTVHGTRVPVRFAVAPLAINNGRPVFLSSTPGVATLTPPIGSGTTRYQIGILVGANGADTTPDVIWAPQYISRTP